MSAAKIYAPFTPEQVQALERWQKKGYVHPFTCGGRYCDRSDREDQGVLIPHQEGWVCPCGAYTQDWAHGFMTSEAARMTHMVIFTPTEWHERKQWLMGLEVADRVKRICGVIPQELICTEVTDMWIRCGAWTFDRFTGKEIDDDIEEVSYILPIDEKESK